MGTLAEFYAEGLAADFLIAEDVKSHRGPALDE